MTDLEQHSAWQANASAWRSYIEKNTDRNHDEIILPALDSLLGDVRGKKILDVGCGEGSVSRFFARKHAIVTGIDFSQNMIDIARDIEPELDIEYKTVSAFDITDHYNIGSFDICIANMALFCFSDISSPIEQISNVLKKNGVFILSILHPCFNLRIYDTSSNVVKGNYYNNNSMHNDWDENSYFRTMQHYRKIHKDFPSETVVYRRMLEEYFSTLRKFNFLVSDFCEPAPNAALISDKKALGIDNYDKYPFFAIISAMKSHDQKTTKALAEFENFLDNRDWQKYQSEKNIAISLSLEAAELLEQFHWMNTQDEMDAYITKNKSDVADELADIYLNLKLFEKKLGISLEDAAVKKIREWSDRYTVTDNKGRFVSMAKKRATRNK